MKKLIGIIFLSAVAMVTVLAAPQGNAHAWWTDFGPNIIVNDDESSTADEDGAEEGEVEIVIDPGVSVNLWWTDHGPNH